MVDIGDPSASWGDAKRLLQPREHFTAELPQEALLIVPGTIAFVVLCRAKAGSPLYELVARSHERSGRCRGSQAR
jgi:hypothetical protein